jgi:hypothetical protein
MINNTFKRLSITSDILLSLANRRKTYSFLCCYVCGYILQPSTKHLNFASDNTYSYYFVNLVLLFLLWNFSNGFVFGFSVLAFSLIGIPLGCFTIRAVFWIPFNKLFSTVDTSLFQFSNSCALQSFEQNSPLHSSPHHPFIHILQVGIQLKQS